MTILLDVVFAFTKGVPELDGAVAGTGDDLSVISTEADGEDIRGVANESAGGLAGVQVPETESVIPRRGERELAVGGDDNVGNEVVVAVENLFGVTVADVVASQLPDDDRLVYRLYETALRRSIKSNNRTSRRGQNHVRVLRRRCDGGDPSLVALQRSQETQRFGHFEWSRSMSMSSSIACSHPSWSHVTQATIVQLYSLRRHPFCRAMAPSCRIIP